MRDVPPVTVEFQLRRVARGQARLSNYHFSYESKQLGEMADDGLQLTFDVDHESMPPTNVHVLIGRNGVGKTTLLKRMARSLVDERAEQSGVGKFIERRRSSSRPEVAIFANVVSVMFSAFDEFSTIDISSDGEDRPKHVYVGLQRGVPLSDQFADSAWSCTLGARLARWKSILEWLESDPLFADSDVSTLAQEGQDEGEFGEQARILFGRLSSGHKIVLLTVTRLVETVDERSLVLMDEPESHLHPPLLSAFIRAMSRLLINRNGVAIIATHSPVVLQEVPNACVWKIARSGDQWAFDRPEIETFGENIGVLTREVFGLEVTKAGFHQMLDQAVNRGGDYEEVLALFDGELGGEAKTLVRTLIALRDSGAL
jgi:predicted ATPase